MQKLGEIFLILYEIGENWTKVTKIFEPFFSLGEQTAAKMVSKREKGWTHTQNPISVTDNIVRQSEKEKEDEEKM